LTVVGAQLRVLSAGPVITVIVPPLADAAMTPADASAANVLVIVTIRVPVAPAATENVTAASCPLAMGVVFSPYATQLAAVVPAEQTTLFPAAVAAGPATTPAVETLPAA
jgi:hypothetical protein